MKITKSILIILALSISVFTGCRQGENNNQSQKAKESNSKIIKVGASPSPHAEILTVAKEILKEEGYDLQIVEYNDYVLPNTSTESGELDANYFQHKPYLDDFNKENKAHLISSATIHYEPLGIYGGKIKALSDLKDKSTVAIPNDSTNEARALQLLQAQGLIKLKEGVGLKATIIDIIENNKNIQIKEIESAQLSRSLEDVDIAVINGNYAIQAGLKVNDALAIEEKNSAAAQTFANIIAIKQGNENNAGIKALIAALKSNKVKEFINSKYNGAVVPSF